MTPAPRSAETAQPHIPVLLGEVVAALDPRDGDLVVDGTFGRGGYSRAILDHARCRVIGVDRDPDAVAAGADLSARMGSLDDAGDGAGGPRLRVVAGNFAEMDRILEGLGAPLCQGVTLDLGVSSPQLDEAGRGFSLRADGPLDMRMGREGATAADVVNGEEEGRLADILYVYGEERQSRRIARAIVKARAEAPLERTMDLVRVVHSVMPRKPQDKIDPATRTFQGLRLYVNDELGALDRGLGAAERILAPGGRLAVVSFHSLEDRIVKRFLADRSGIRPAGSRHMPTAADTGPDATFRLAPRKQVSPTDAEIARNPRARSARLRAAIRTEAPAWPGAAAGLAPNLGEKTSKKGGAR